MRNGRAGKERAPGFLPAGSRPKKYLLVHMLPVDGNMASQSRDRSRFVGFHFSGQAGEKFPGFPFIQEAQKLRLTLKRALFKASSLKNTGHQRFSEMGADALDDAKAPALYPEKLREDELDFRRDT